MFIWYPSPEGSSVLSLETSSETWDSHLVVNETCWSPFLTFPMHKMGIIMSPVVIVKVKKNEGEELFKVSVNIRFGVCITTAYIKNTTSRNSGHSQCPHDIESFTWHKETIQLSMERKSFSMAFIHLGRIHHTSMCFCEYRGSKVNHDSHGSCPYRACWLL